MMNGRGRGCGGRRGSPGVLRSAGAGWALLLLLSASLAAQTGGRELEGLPVSRIEFFGLDQISRDSVLALMETREGRPFNGEALERDLRVLAGYSPVVERPKPPGVGRTPEEGASKPSVPRVFAAIPSVTARKDDGGGVLITINGTENRRVLGLVFLGAVEFKRSDLLPVIKTRTGSPVDDFTLELDRQDLRRFYQEKGYHFASVGFIKEFDPSGEIIIFTITEGPKVTIRNVVFEGAKSFSPRELMKEMPFVDTPGFLSKQIYVAEQVRRDAVQLGLWYQGRGFLDARVTWMDAIPSSDNETMDLSFLVEEGEQYMVRSIAVEGLTLFPPDEFLATMRTKAGERYEPAGRLQRDMRELRDRILEFGYIDAQVVDRSTYGLEGNEVDVVLHVVEGELALVGSIVISGNIQTRDRIIRREIELYTGEPMNLKKLDRARQRIRALGYWQMPRGSTVGTETTSFQDYQIYREAYITLKDTPRERVKDIVVELEEADTGSLRFAAGIGSNAGFIGDITYSKMNFDPLDWPESFGDILNAFTGGGQFLVLSFQPGTNFSRWRAAWGNPRIFDSLWSVVGEIYATDWRREDWREDRFGYSGKIGRRLGDDLSGALTLRDEFVTVKRIDSDAPQLVFDFEGKNRVVSLTQEFRLDRLNDFLDPSSGYRVELLFEHAGLWGDVEFNKVMLKGEHYFELSEDDMGRLTVLRLQGTAGWASEFGDTRDVPVFERFYAGGQGTLRGFRFRGVGPRDNDSPIGGKAMWLLSAEYQFPLWEEFLRGVAFMDSGSVALDWGDSGVWDVRASVGFGLRILIPFLGERPLAIDFGIPLLKEREDDTQFISFSFGYR